MGIWRAAAAGRGRRGRQGGWGEGEGGGVYSRWCFIGRRFGLQLYFLVSADVGAGTFDSRSLFLYISLLKVIYTAYAPLPF